MEKSKCYISLGSNLGDSILVLKKANNVIEARIGNVIAKSSLYRSEPWGFEADNDFVNAVIIVETELHPKQVLEQLLIIEKDFGRERKKTAGYESRILDLDIISYEQEVIHKEGLIVPHPKMHLRSFVLVPLREVDNSWIHPVTKETVGQLILVLDDDSKVNKITII
ncbi:MAG: 2-amino-4-hydroxy-6-hydroxymethyldihydropteridine diphosphokinase [Crocinitomicaceae bacterium]|nr:2-amino-4-hydroxy-6-hydroxymethyldihydropteridine diphosphokinase [Crocinitomicaceae bacterium]